jgi:hypothetical protein
MRPGSAPPVALVSGHPGRELRVHGGLERHRPIVIIITDGSGSRCRSRPASTHAVRRGRKRGQAPSSAALATAASITRLVDAAEVYPELREEVKMILARDGRDAFRDEWLRPADYRLSIAGQVGPAPFHERYGAERVASGVYEQVIRFRDHVEPIAAVLAARAARTVRA